VYIGTPEERALTDNNNLEVDTGDGESGAN
jgi:hypothetical protein